MMQTEIVSMTEPAAKALQQNTPEKEAFAPGRSPVRVLWAAGLFAVLWFLPLLIQGVFSPHTMFCANAQYFYSLAVLAAGLYFLCLPGMKRKLAGGGLALTGAVLLAFSASIAKNIKAYVYQIELGRLFNLRNIYLYIVLRNALFCAALAVAGALLVQYLLRSRSEKTRYTAAGGTAAGAYFLTNTVTTFWMYRFQLGNFRARNYAIIVVELLMDAFCLYLVFLAIGHLGSMENTRVKLKGIGLAWAWLALCAMSVALIAYIAFGNELAGPGSYTTQFILLAAGVTGYAMLLCKRRAGLYVILLGAGVLLAAQTLSLLEGVFYGADGYGALLASSLLGGLNPLFACLAVRAAKSANSTGHLSTDSKNA